MRARRALLYMPGDDLHKIRKATTLDVDCICMDLEDGVSINRKEAARDTIASALLNIDFGRSERLVRINPIGSGFESVDLQKILPSKPDGIVIPKVSEPSQVTLVSQEISRLEGQYGLAEGIVIIALIETAMGIVKLREIASCSSRLVALIFGAEDLVADLGALPSKLKEELIYARSKVVTFATAYGLQAIDMVFVDLDDPAGLLTQAFQSVQLGYSGMQVIHPNQVQPVQDAFTPNDESIRAARIIIEAYASHRAAGRGAFTLNGKMVDAPIVKSAQATLEKAKAAGKI